MKRDNFILYFYSKNWDTNFKCRTVNLVWCRRNCRSHCGRLHQWLFWHECLYLCIHAYIGSTNSEWNFKINSHKKILVKLNWNISVSIILFSCTLHICYIGLYMQFLCYHFFSILVFKHFCYSCLRYHFISHILHKFLIQI